MAGEGPAVAQHPEGRVEIALQTATCATQFWVSSVSLLAFTHSLLLYFLKGNEGNLIPSKHILGYQIIPSLLQFTQTSTPLENVTFSMSRAQVPTLDLVHRLAHYCPVYAPMFAGTSKKLQRGSREGLWSSLGHWLHFEWWRGQMWREHIDKQETWNQVPQSPVRYGCWFWSDQFLPFFFHCFHLPHSFGLFLLPTMLQVL